MVTTLLEMMIKLPGMVTIVHYLVEKLQTQLHNRHFTFIDELLMKENNQTILILIS